MKHTYSYSGTVLSFGQCVSSHWEASSYAETESKARNNMAFQYKQQHGLAASSSISLPGKIKEM